MTCSKRDGCTDIYTLKIVGNAMRHKLADQEIELRRQMIRISFMEDMIEAERQTGKFAMGIAVIEFLVIVFCIISMWAGGQVA